MATMVYLSSGEAVAVQPEVDEVANRLASRAASSELFEKFDLQATTAGSIQIAPEHVTHLQAIPAGPS